MDFITNRVKITCADQSKVFFHKPFCPALFNKNWNSVRDWIVVFKKWAMWELVTEFIPFLKPLIIKKVGVLQRDEFI